MRLLLPFLTGCSLALSSPEPTPLTIQQEPGDFWTVRAAHPTRLLHHGPSPQPWEEEPLPRAVRAVTFPSPAGNLKGWLLAPPDGKQVHPAVVYFHGGFAWGLEDLVVCLPLVEAGYTVFTPTLRGENGNPGEFEHYFGEVDDAVAAVRWLAQQPEVDATHIFTLGHSAGGVISGFMSLVPDLPVRATASIGGTYPEQTFVVFDQKEPFDTANGTERRLRGWVHYLGSVKRPHFAWVGRKDWLAQWVAPLEAAVIATKAPVRVTLVDGDHGGSIEPAMQAFLAQIQAL